ERSRWGEYAVFLEEQYPNLRLANPDCALQHRPEHRLQLAWRACNDSQDIESRALLVQGLPFGAGTSRYLLPQGLIGVTKLPGSLFHPTIQVGIRPTQIFLDGFPHRDIGTERQAWNADADQEYKHQKKRIVEAGGGEWSGARKRSPNRKAGEDQRCHRRVART